MNSGCFNGTDDEDECNHDDTGDKIMTIMMIFKMLMMMMMMMVMMIGPVDREDGCQ